MDTRIKDLIEKMTLEEKISMLAGVDMWQTVAIERLGIPAIKMTDGPHGNRTIDDDDPWRRLPATCYPTGVSMGASWNPDLIHRLGQALGEETKSKGCDILLGPCINIQRSPLAGRNFESFSEDPYLVSRIAVAYVGGVQSQGVGTSVKHFACNNSEFERSTISSQIGERVFREIYLPGFKATVQECQPWTIMSSYNKINGTWTSENKYLLTDILKNEWGFEGFVVSDWQAVRSTVPTANAGLDLEMPGPAVFLGDELLSAVKAGEVSEDIIDDKVQRILRIISIAGAFESPKTVDEAAADTPEHRKLAREVAGEAIVLLKNENNILPIKTGRVKTMAVIGPNANEARFEGGGSSRVKPYYTVTPLEGLTEKCGDEIKITYEPGCKNYRLVPRIEPEWLNPGSDEEGHGLSAEYYNSHDLSGPPVLTRVDERLGLPWLVEPVPNLNLEEFSVRWTGVFTPPVSGRYKFSLLSGGLSRLYLDDELLVDNWSGQLPNTEGGGRLPGEKVSECEMTSGKSYNIKAEYSRSNAAMAVIRLGCDVPLSGDPMKQAVDAASKTDVALVFVGTSEEHESEGFDRESMDLPGNQIELIEAVAEVNKNTIVVLNNGSPISMTGWINRVAAVVEAWFPGQEGGNAIADIIFGHVNPSGKLPLTFPKRIEDNPAYLNYPGENGKVLYGEGLFVGYRYYDAKKIEPLFPFGYGLSYTTFEYENLNLSTARLGTDDKLEVTLVVKNTGDTAGKEAVQLYIRDVESTLVRPEKELKGFCKVDLKPGQKKSVSFTIGSEELSFYDPDLKKWMAEPGDFEILVGASSRDIRARAVFSLVE